VVRYTGEVQALLQDRCYPATPQPAPKISPHLVRQREADALADGPVSQFGVSHGARRIAVQRAGSTPMVASRPATSWPPALVELVAELAGR